MISDAQIRAEILIALWELYEDPLTRSQYKRFEFRGESARQAGEALAWLSRTSIVELLSSRVARLSEIGAKVVRAEIGRLQSELSVSRETKEEFPGRPLIPSPDEILKASEGINRVDFVAAFSISDRRYGLVWASAGFKAVTGYTVEEIRTADGWPDDRSSHTDPGNGEKSFSDQIAGISGGEKVEGRFSIRTKGGAIRLIRFHAIPRWNADHSKVIGFASALEDITSSGDPAQPVPPPKAAA